jgi:hypothetical protein
LIEPGSVREIAAIGDEHKALIVVTFRIGLRPGATMMTMARSCLYPVNDDGKIEEERHTFYVVPQESFTEFVVTQIPPAPGQRLLPIIRSHHLRSDAGKARGKAIGDS